MSIGNIAVGGRAKTPIAALVAARLRDMGERPAILSRGYGRRDAPDGVVVVRDPEGIRADLDRAGDEPLMLARGLDGVAVLVARERYLAGRLAEHHFGCTVHVLDDGFQHFDLHRDADLVIVARADLEQARTLPSGRLREPVDAAASADGFIALSDDVPVARLDPVDRPVWRARRALQAVRTVEGTVLSPASGPIVAVAGIAQPQAFFEDLRAAGWTVASGMAFPDHHRFSARDLRVIFDAAHNLGAAAVVTTEKDLVRLLRFRPFAGVLAFAPQVVTIDDIASLDSWLRGRLAVAR